VLKTQGHYSHIRNNKLKSGALLFAYLGVSLLMCVAISLMVAITTTRGTIDAKYASALRLFGAEWLHMLAIAFAWAGLASLQFQKQIGAALHANPMPRNVNIPLYNLVENLSIACGIPIPSISIVETPAMNAFMTGWTIKRTTLTLTRGLLSNLNPDQLKSVVAHEMIKTFTGDTRHLSLATVFTSICLYTATFIFKPIYKPGFRTLVLLLALPFYPYQIGMVMAVAACTAVMGALIIKLSISKLRVYVADAGACELTKDPESLISAIRIIAHNDSVPGMDIACQPLLFSGTRSNWFSSHPDADQRITAIKSYIPNIVEASSPSFLSALVKNPQTDDWRSHLVLPNWVVATSTIVPVLAMALLFMSTTHWRLSDKNEVEQYRDSIEASLEYVARVAGPNSGINVDKIAADQEAYYGIKLDHEKLRKIAAKSKVGFNNTAFTFKAGSDETAISQSPSGINMINLGTEEGRQIERSLYPTAEEQVRIDRLNEASWNKGSVPTMRFWIPAALLMMLWHIFKSLSSIGSWTTRKAFRK
jgi:heat shock protein HtpX